MSAIATPRDHAALVAYLRRRAAMPFIWGSKANDCVSFVGGAVLAQTGRDPFAGLRWSGKISAFRMIARIGGEGGLGDAVATRMREIPPALAFRGDAALVASAGEPVLMLVDGALLIGPGNTRAQRSEILRAYSAVLRP